MPVTLGGTTDEILVSDDDSLSFSSGMFISLWVLRQNNNRAETLVTKATNGFTTGEYTLGFLNDNKLYFLLRNTGGGGNWIGRTAPDFNSGAWHHIVATWDGGTTAASIKIYIDGVQADNANSTAGSFTGMANTAHPLRIGGPGHILGPQGFDGTLDEVAIGNIDLSLAKVNQLYNPKIRYMPRQILFPNLTGGYWSLDDGQDGTAANGDTAKDLSGVGNDGVGNGGAGLVWEAGRILSYPPGVFPIFFTSAVAPPVAPSLTLNLKSPFIKTQTHSSNITNTQNYSSKLTKTLLYHSTRN